MANRDLGTAVLNIKILFDKLSKSDITAQLNEIKKLIDQFFASQTGGSSPIDNLGKKISDGIVNGIKKNQGNVKQAVSAVAQAATSPFLDQITNLEKQFQATLKRIAAIRSGAKGGLSPAQATELAELKQIANNIRSEINLAKARAARDPSFKIAEVGKRRADEIERVSSKLEKQAGVITKLSGVIKELERSYIKAGNKSVAFIDAVDAAKQNFEKLASSTVKANEKTLNYQQLQEKLRNTYLKSRESIKRNIKDTELQAAMLTQLYHAFDKVGTAELKASRNKYSAKIQKQASEITKLTAKLVELANAFSKTKGTTNDVQSFTEATTASFKKLFDQVVKSKSKFQDYNQLLKSLKQTYRDQRTDILANIKDIDLQRIALENLRKEAQRAKNRGARRVAFFDELRAAETSIPTATRSQLMQAKSTLEAKRNFKATKEQAQALDRVLAKINAQIQKLDRNRLQNIQRGIHTVTSGVNQFGEQLRRVSFILRDVGRQMMMISRRGFGFVKPVIDDFIKFEQSVTDVLAITGDLNNGLTKTDVVGTNLGQTILKLAGQFSFSADQIAETAKQLALAGFSTAQITESLESVIKLAAATGSELSVAANIVISSLSTFGLEAEHATRVTDVFAATVTRANTNLSQLSEAFKIVAPVAASNGQSIEQVAAALGVLANSGLKGTLAGTGLARVFTQLTEKSGKLDALFKSLGSSFDAIDPEKRDFSEIVAQFDRLNLSTASLLQIFELRAFRSLNAILAQGSARLGTFADQLERANRVADAISSARLNTLGTSIQLLSDALTSLRITLGQLVSTELNSIVNFFKGIVVNLKELIEINKKEVAVVARGLVAFLGLLGSIGTALFTAGSAAAFFAAPLITIGAGLAALNAAFGAAVTAATAFGVTIGTALAPVIASILAVTTLVFGFFAGLAGLFSSLTVSISVASREWGIAFSGFSETVKYVFEKVITPIYNGFLSRTREIVRSTRILIASIGEAFDTSFIEDGNWESFGKFLAVIVETMLEFAAVIIKELTPAIQTIAKSLSDFTIGLKASEPMLNRYKMALLELGKGISKFPFKDLLLLGTPAGGGWIANDLGDVILQLINNRRKGKDPTKEADRKTKADALMAELRDQNNAIAQAASSAGEYAAQLSKVSSIFGKFSQAKPVEFSKLISTDVSEEARKKQLENIQTQIDFLTKFREKAKGVLRLSEIDSRIEDLRKSQQIIEGIGEKIDFINKLISGKTADQITESISDGVSKEIDKLNAVDNITAKIVKFQSIIAAKGSVGADEINKVKTEIENLLGIKVNLNRDNPVQSLVEIIRTELDTAKKAGQEALSVYDDLLKILPKLEGINLNTEKGRKAFAEAFSELSKNQEKLQKITDLEQERLDIQEKIKVAGMDAHEKRMYELDEEFNKRKEILEQLKEARKIEIETTERDILAARAKGDLEAVAKLEDQLKAAQEGLDAALRTQAEAKANLFLNTLDEMAKVKEARDKAEAEATRATENAELKLMEMKLDTEEEIDKRIELRQRIAKIRRKSQLEADIRDLEEKLLAVGRDDELERKVAELKAANDIAEAAENQKIADEEMKVTKDQANKVVDKRLDLETELLNNLGKQVTSLQQMAALMQFIEALQRRKDRKALQDIGKLAKAREKLNRLEKLVAGGGEKGDKAMLALQRAQDEFAFLGGIVERGAGMAGVPKAVQINANALMGNLVVSLDNLTKAITDFDLGNALGGIIPGGLNVGAGNRLVGANFGTINHNDNSVININAKTVDMNQLAKLLGRQPV